MSEKVGIFSFFAGAGFLDLGFETTENYEVVFVNEYHKPFMEIYEFARKNMGIPQPKYGKHVCDISDFLGDEKGMELTKSITCARNEFDLIGFIGGPPCPDFSVAGKNRGSKGENGRLSGTYIELIKMYSPDFFLFENVKGLYRTKKHREFFDSLKRKLTRAGYQLTEKLINSIEYGAPQDRERIILIGFKNELLDSNISLKNDFDWDFGTSYSKNEILSLNWPRQEDFREHGARPIPEGLPIELTVQHWFDKNDVTNHPNSEHYFTPRAALEKFKVIDEGDDLKKSYKRLHRWRYSPTAAYGNNEVHLHPYMPRRLSAAEALAVQSLPKEFVMPETATLSNMFKSIGNGVPFMAAKGLANSILGFTSKVNINLKEYEEVNCE